MATVAGLVSRARLELGDRGTTFITSATGDGLATRFEVQHKPLALNTLVYSKGAASAAVLLAVGVDYTIDTEHGTLQFPSPVAAGTTITTSGLAFTYFGDADWTTFVNTAVSEHLHNRSGVSLANLDLVEEYPLALLATIQALYVLVNEAAAQIDVSTPEGISIPRHQRYEQLMQMLISRQDQYNKLASMLNVGLGRIEMFNLRRVSRMTGRLVPLYTDREIEDTRMPNRVFPPIDLGGGSDVAGADGAATQDITFRQGNDYSLPLDFSFDLTGYTVYAALRRYPGSARMREFSVVYTNLALGQITVSLTNSQTRILPHQLFWDLFLEDPSGNETPYLKGRVQVERSRTQLTQGYGG